MKKNGFTFVELMAVIIIVAILTLIAAPAVTKFINSAQSTTDESTLNALEDAALDYALHNNVFISNDCGINYLLSDTKNYNETSSCPKISIKVSTLREEGYFKDDSNKVKKSGEVILYKYDDPSTSNVSYELKAFASTSLLN